MKSATDNQHPDYLSAWQAHHEALVAALAAAFARQLSENREELKSAQRGAAIAADIVELAGRYLHGEATHFDVGAAAAQLAKQGLAMVSGSHLMHALNDVVYTEILPQLAAAAPPDHILRPLHEFQLIFLEKLAETREVVQLRAQEESQIALQQALYTQLEQQRHLRESVEQRSQSLNQVLLLNARLARAQSESELLDAAVSGICQALELAHVTIYERPSPTAVWQMRTTTADNPAQVAPTQPDVLHALQAAQADSQGEHVHQHHKTRRQTDLTVTLNLPLSEGRLSALRAYSSQTAPHEQAELTILLRTFGQGLANLWRNLFLLLETSQRARELEILHGRYVDSLWATEQAALTAHITAGEMSIQRQPEQLAAPTTAQSPSPTIPLRIGERPFGHVILPANANLNEADEEFIQALIREMGTALNNAYLLQTTRAYSNQLQLAAEVSRVATTMLDRDHLIAEVVELIRARFDYYYVGLFLVDGQREKAILWAGTGEAGRRQVQQGRQLPIGGGSMVGSAIADNQTKVAPNVALAPDFARNPFLPMTKAELALPLRSRGEVIGALTVQSASENAFTAEALTVLQNMADQLASAITNADLFTQIQANLHETNLLYEVGRQINEARNPGDLFNALIDFARSSAVVDMAQIIIVGNPDYLACPAMWSSDEIRWPPHGRYPQPHLLYDYDLHKNEIVILQDPQALFPAEDASPLPAAIAHLKTAALIPLLVENQLFGALVLYSSTPHIFQERSLQPFRTLADQAAISLANQQLLRQTELLYQIGRSLSQSLTRDDALMIAVQEIAQYTGVSQCRLVLYDSQTNAGYIAAAAFPEPEQETAVFPMGDDYAFTYLAAHRQPLLLGEAADNTPAEVLERYVQPFGGAYSLLIPAASQQELIGFLALDAPSKRPLSGNNIIFAQTVVEHLTTQIENLKLLDEALTSAQELIFLNQIQSNISSILNLEDLAQSIYQEVGGLMDNTIFLLAQYNAETRLYKPILAVHDDQPLSTEERTLHREEALVTFLHGRTHLLSDSNTPHVLPHAFPSPTAAQSGLWIPMSREGSPTGLICVQSRQPHAYRENDVQLLRSIATQAGLAIENARLFEQIQASVAQLRQIDHMKNQFLANMSHELRTPLNSIIGFSRVILKGIDGPLTAEQEEDLTSIYNNGQHLLMLINEILDMAKIGAGKMKLAFEPVSLPEVAETVLGNIRSLVPPQVRLESHIAADLPLIAADPVRIRQILINLLSNAAKFTKVGAITLNIKREDADHVLIKVADTGIGIAPEDFDKLFVAFEQVDNSTTRTAGGTGLGLPITQWLVTMHGGALWLESEVGQGTTFFVRLPLQQSAETESSATWLPTAVN